ncbi:hypothetical protein H7F50_13655 [Novosphingobium flavum]|nr:hypothetical protein [Novosphingobium aerophilum]
MVSGEIVAGPHVRNACKRHIADLKRKDGIWFDHDAANHAFAFFEEVLKLSEGQFEGEPFRLEPSQAFIVGSLFGWKRKDGRRRFRRAYIEQGKGNGKSPVAGGIGIYGMTACKEAGAQIYAAAAKKEQANILFRDAVRMVRQSPALARRLEFSGGPGREFNIAHLASGSFFRPVSRDTGKTGSGPRPYFVLADEVHELPDRSIIEMLERGFKFRRDPLLFMITNSGSDRNSVAWEEHEHAIRVAAGNPDAVTDPTFLGQVIDDTTFSYVCALDEGDDPLTDPSCWIKANPLLGVTITEQYLSEVVAQAKAIPGQLNGILRLHFCVWTDAETAWMARATLEPLRGRRMRQGDARVGIERVEAVANRRADIAGREKVGEMLAPKAGHRLFELRQVRRDRMRQQGRLGDLADQIDKMAELMIQRAAEQRHRFIQPRHPDEDQPTLGQGLVVPRQRLAHIIPRIAHLEMKVALVGQRGRDDASIWQPFRDRKAQAIFDFIGGLLGGRAQQIAVRGPHTFDESAHDLVIITWRGFEDVPHDAGERLGMLVQRPIEIGRLRQAGKAFQEEAEISLGMQGSAPNCGALHAPLPG